MSRDCSGEATPAREGFPAIVVVDHQLLVLSLLNEVLLSKFENFEILALSETDELERIAERDLRLVILRAPEGCEAEQLNYCNRIAEALEGVPVLLLCDRSDERLAAAALASGYRGLVSNCTPVGILLAAIQLVLAGGAYFPITNSGSRGEAAGHEEDLRAQASLEAGMQPTQAAPTGPEAAFGLTLRELEVLAQLRRGRPNKQIARDLSISENTAKMHVRRILAKLRVKNRIEAVLMLQSRLDGAPALLDGARRRGLDDPDRVE